MIFANRHFLFSVCLLATVGLCEDVTEVTVSGSDDGSCKIPSYFQCGNITWSNCTQGVGKGNCINEKSNKPCSINIKSKDNYRCKVNSCGDISCPGSYTMDCMAGWGSDSYSQWNHPDNHWEIPDECLSTYKLDDGSCLIPPSIRCDNVFWSHCQLKEGVGHCTSEKSSEPCGVIMYPKGSNDSEQKCPHDCGVIECPVNCVYNQNCDCQISWGQDDRTSEIFEYPEHCSSSTKPKNSGHSLTFLVVAIGVPLSVTATTIAIVVSALICRYRIRAGYERIN